MLGLGYYDRRLRSETGGFPVNPLSHRAVWFLVSNGDA